MSCELVFRGESYGWKAQFFERGELFGGHGGFATKADVTPDGQRFLMLKEKPHVAPPVKEMVFVQNWFEEPTARVPTK